MWLRPESEDGAPVHTVLNVYPVMLRQICLDYSTLPPVLSMTLAQIEFFYEGLRPDLYERTKKK